MTYKTEQIHRGATLYDPKWKEILTYTGIHDSTNWMFYNEAGTAKFKTKEEVEHLDLINI